MKTHPQHQREALLWLQLTHEDLVLGELQLLQGDHVLAVHGRLQGRLVDQVLQVGPREAHGSPGDDTGLDGCKTQ